MRKCRLVAQRAVVPRLGCRCRGFCHARIGEFRRLPAHRLRQRDIGVARRALGLGERRIERGEPRRRLVGALGKRLRFGVEPSKRLGGIDRQCALALAILGDPSALIGELGDPPLGRIMLGTQPRQRMRRLRRRLARRQCRAPRLGQRGRRRRLMRRRRALRLGASATLILARRGFRLGRVRRRRGIAPAREDHPAFGHADLARQLAIALGLPRLPPQRVGARFLVGHDLVEPHQIGLGRAQFLLGVLAADVQARNPRRFLQHRAALGGLGGDHRADPALADQRRRMRPGRGVGEQQRNVLRAHVTPVDAIRAPRAALDPPHDFGLAAVDFGQDRHFGEIARGPRIGAGEDDVVHPRAAHRLRAVLAHRPAQRFEQVRLAAAIGADHAGQPGLDPQIGASTKLLKPDSLQSFDLHRVGRPRRRVRRRAP